MALTRPDIAIIGAGVVGTTLGVSAARAGYKIVGVASLSIDSARKAAEIIGNAAIVCSADEAARRAELLLLTVPDDAIGPLGEELADRSAVRAGTVAAHCSGALASDVLAPLADRCGALLASMHPLQTFPDVSAGLANIRGCHCFCEGQAKALSAVMQLAGDIGCVPVEIAPDRKTLYHASACIACNYLATLQEAAIAAAKLAGIGRQAARQALAPLVAATAKNIAICDTGPALTGPIARGDVQTVLRHITALDAVDPKLAGLYRHLGLRTVDLAEQAGKIGPEAAERLREILHERG